MASDQVIAIVELTDDQALAIAQFVKRVGWSEMRGCAVDDEEAYSIRSALGQLDKALTQAGYSPR